jgi:arylformamidase
LQPNLQLTWGEVLSQSPLLNLPEEAPPLLVSYGEEETYELRRQSEDFLDAWGERGLPGELLPQPGKHHFSAIDGFLDADSLLCSPILERLHA